MLTIDGVDMSHLCVFCRERPVEAGKGQCTRCGQLCDCGHPKGRHRGLLGSCLVHSGRKYVGMCNCSRFTPA